jgi:hypothetical protein
VSSLFNLRPANFDSIRVESKSHCVSVAKYLHAQQIKNTTLPRSAYEIAKSVLNRSGTDLSITERRQLPYVMFDKTLNELASPFAAKVFEGFSASNLFWARLFRAWLNEYTLESELGLKVVTELEKNQYKLPEIERTLATYYPILDTHPNFDPTIQRLLSGSAPKEDLFALGISDGEVTTRFAEKLFREAAKRLSNGFVNSQQLDKFKTLVVDGERIHDSVKLAAMVGLILGCQKLSPGETFVKDIAKIIEANFDDPVLHKGRWPAVPEDLGGIGARNRCIETVKRWQTFRSITLFFSIIEKVVQGQHSHQFPVRRAFWLKYFEQGLVQDAWVILGTKAQSEISRLRLEIDDLASLRWGRLTGASSDQSALLLRLGDITVMEFSHSGRARIWGEKDKSSPRFKTIPELHAKSYSADNLRADCPENQMFTHDPSGTWRISVDRCITRLSGKTMKL